jgi:hypothetical protein
MPRLYSVQLAFSSLLAYLLILFQLAHPFASIPIKFIQSSSYVVSEPRFSWSHFSKILAKMAIRFSVFHFKFTVCLESLWHPSVDKSSHSFS